MFFFQAKRTPQQKAWDQLRELALAQERQRVRRDRTVLKGSVSASLLYELLPPMFESPELSLNYDFTPLHATGGDLLDFWWIDRNHIAFYLFDIAGHDETSGLIALALRQLLARRLSSTWSKNPERVLNYLNQEIAREDNDFLFVTMWCGTLDLITGKLTFSSAGSPPALWVPESGEPAGFKRKSLPLGIDRNFRYSQESLTLSDKGCLYLMSDGTYEIELTKTGHYLSWEGLKKFIATRNYLTPHERNPEPVEAKKLIANLTKEKRLLDDFSLMKITVNLFPKESPHE